MKNSDVVVIGGGLYGQIIAAALRKEGALVYLIDKGHEGKGSLPAACLMKPSWFSGLGPKVHEPALMLLDELYGVQTVRFTVGINAVKMDVYWVDPKQILLPPDTNEEVVAVSEDRGVEFADGTVMLPEKVVVCAGVWTEKLLPQYKQTAQQGVAFRYDGQIKQPFIQPWRPYCQLVGFNISPDHVWVSDGTAVKRENWTDDRTMDCMHRTNNALAVRGFSSPTPGIEVMHGYRPYAKGHKPCLFEHVSDNIWVASGGAKNGTIGAAWCASELRKRLW
jgi:glycine/D-amino acid oxidase-like deaminating enzyme